MIRHPFDQSDNEEIQPGFSLVRLQVFDDDHGCQTNTAKLLLPLAKVTSLLSENKARANEAEKTHEQKRDASLKVISDIVDKSFGPDPDEFDLAATKEPEPSTEMLVPCVFKEDVLREALAVKSSTRIAERDRSTVVKNVCKALMDRPSCSRKIGLPFNLDQAFERLEAIAPHVPELVEALRGPLKLSLATGTPPVIAPLLLVGPPGVGKTYLATEIAKVFGVPLHVQSYASPSNAGSNLIGSDKHWGNTTTGQVFNLLAMGDFANPLICLDEIDKSSTSANQYGQEKKPLNELLTLLEPVTAKSFQDQCLEIRVDASHILWLATANSLKGLSAPLLSRFQLIQVNKPDARASISIALSIAQSIQTQLGLDMPPPRGEVLQLMATLTPRGMRKIWTQAVGLAAECGRNSVSLADVEKALSPSHPPDPKPKAYLH